MRSLVDSRANYESVNSGEGGLIGCLEMPRRLAFRLQRGGMGLPVIPALCGFPDHLVQETGEVT